MPTLKVPNNIAASSTMETHPRAQPTQTTTHESADWFQNDFVTPRKWFRRRIPVPLALTGSQILYPIVIDAGDANQRGTPNVSLTTWNDICHFTAHGHGIWRTDMGEVIRFVSKAERERARLIREARARYDSIFPPASFGSEQRDSGDELAES
jgi:hypothetical protein